MSKPQQNKRNKLRLARLEIVARLYKRGYSVRKIRDEVKTRLDLDTYSVSTCQSDIQTLLAEWRENRIDDMDAALQLELERIDDTVRELWEQWEKSKEDYTKTTQTRKGSPQRDAETNQQRMKTFLVESREAQIVGLGNTQYIAEIRQQLAERRKLLGLYAAEKKDLSGGVSFAAYLMESGVIDDADATETAAQK